MSSTESHKRASARYDAKNTKLIQLKLNLKTDEDILKKLDEVGNKQGYIKSLIKKDMPLPLYLQGDGYSDGELVIDTGICENCNAHYEIDYEHYKYCPNCGQRLDWLQVEEE